MARGGEASLNDLRRGAERSRAEFTETVEELRSKVYDAAAEIRERTSPDAVKAQVGQFIRSRAESLIDAARKNPLPATAIGAGLALPLLRLVRSIPAPILMVGAGIYLAGSSSGKRVTQRLGALADDVLDQASPGVDELGNRIHAVRDRAVDGMASARETLSQGVDSLKQEAAEVGAALSNAADRASGIAADVFGSASDRGGDLERQASEAINYALEALRDGAEAASSMSQRAAAQASDVGLAAGRRVRDRAVEAAQNTSTVVNDSVQRNPLLVGGIGLAIGMLIASLLPRSDIEDGVLGRAKRVAEKRAAGVASKGLRAATGVASAIAADIADEARQEGVTPTGLSEAVDDLGRRVRKVADAAAATAITGVNDQKTDDAA